LIRTRERTEKERRQRDRDRERERETERQRHRQSALTVVLCNELVHGSATSVEKLGSKVVAATRLERH
jgi:hypothetical protein